MSTVFLLPLALTLLSGVQEAPIWLDQFGLGAEEFLSRASQMGLKEESIRDVMTEIDRSGPPCAASLTKLAESWRAEGVDLFAFLRQLVEDDVAPPLTANKPALLKLQNILPSMMTAQANDAASLSRVVAHTNANKQWKNPRANSLGVKFYSRL